MEHIRKIIREHQVLFASDRCIEIACGDSEFTVALAPFVRHIEATDIDLTRSEKQRADRVPAHIHFEEVDALKLSQSYENETLIIEYNALAHFDDELENMVHEVIKTLTSTGKFIMIGTWKMERKILAGDFVEFLKGIDDISVEITNDSNYDIVVLIKN